MRSRLPSRAVFVPGFASGEGGATVMGGPLLKKLLLALLLAATPALADAPIVVHLKNHKFTPSVIKVKANQPAMIILFNDDDSADEFDSSSLKIERVVPGHAKGNIRLRALAPGKYPFMGEFHAATAQGVVIAE